IGLFRPLEPPIVINPVSIPASQWVLSTNGWRLLSVQISAAQAVGLRLHLQEISLPPGAQLIAYNAIDSSEPTLLLEGPVRIADFWAPTIFSQQALVQCQLPPDASPDSARFSITGVSHIFI